MQVNTKLLMHFGLLSAFLGSAILFIYGYYDIPVLGGVLNIISFPVGEGFLVAGVVAMLISFTILPGDYYPIITRGIFRDIRDVEEFKQIFEQGLDPDLQRIIWYVYNLPPADLLNFFTLITEMRNAANDEGMRRIANYMRQQ